MYFIAPLLIQDAFMSSAYTIYLGGANARRGLGRLSYCLFHRGRDRRRDVLPLLYSPISSAYLPPKPSLFSSLPSYRERETLPLAILIIPDGNGICTVAGSVSRSMQQ